MNKPDIARLRIVNQQIARSEFTTPKEIVSYLGAVQAQEYTMAKWAVATRLQQCTEEQVEDALKKGEIIRIHILRPTWHFVTAEDVHWMLALTAPYVKKAISSMCRKLALDDQVFTKAKDIITRSLEGGKQLTKQELVAEISKAGVNADDLRGSHMILEAELSGIICNGDRRGNQLTYTLLDEIVPIKPSFTKEEALAELGLRYFTSHGPATIYDFAWWSGLSMADVKLSLELSKVNLTSVVIEEKQYWFSGSSTMEALSPEALYLLPAFDEFLVSYKDRSAALPPEYKKTVITNNGIFKPIMIKDGIVLGCWKPTVQKLEVSLDLQWFNPAIKPETEQLAAATEKFGLFLNKTVKTVKRSLGARV